MAFSRLLFWWKSLIADDWHGSKYACKELTKLDRTKLDLTDGQAMELAGFLNVRFTIVSNL